MRLSQFMVGKNVAVFIGNNEYSASEYLALDEWDELGTVYRGVWTADDVHTTAIILEDAEVLAEREMGA